MREIGAAYDTYGNPLQHLASLDPPVPAIHLYTQPRHRDYREGQVAFARENPWFRPQLLNAVSHFPTVDEPQAGGGGGDFRLRIIERPICPATLSKPRPHPQITGIPTHTARTP